MADRQDAKRSHSIIGIDYGQNQVSFAQRASIALDSPLHDEPTNRAAGLFLKTGYLVDYGLGPELQRS